MINIAYIDGTNLYKGIRDLNFELDYVRFRKWLLHKYRIKKAYIFLGYIAEQNQLYSYLQRAGFELIFKESVTQNGVVKGNADSELVLKSVRDVFEQNPKKTIIVSGDGDFSCLIDFLLEKQCFQTVLVPNKRYCSYLLRKKGCSLTFLDDSKLLAKFAKPRQSKKTPNRH